MNSSGSPHALISLACVTVLAASSIAVGRQSATAIDSVPPAAFADAERARKLAAALPEVESIFLEWVKRANVPGAVMGVIVDGELVWVKGVGVREAGGSDAVTSDTVFRIASMTKSFTAMAILKLRDEGKLSLDDPTSRYVPDLAALAYPTTDSPVITIRHLLTHSEGFPEDNPWGDRQLAVSDETMRKWMREGIPFSTVPGTAWEYSNYGFAILGQVVAKASGKPYAQYVRENILVPLGMSATTFEMSEVPRDRMAIGHRWEDEKWKPEPMLAHGSFGAMGGLWTSARDLAKYVTFLMSAFPARNGADRGPILRSSAREMQQGWRATGPPSAFRRAIDGRLELSSSAYGYGLMMSSDCHFGSMVAHSGGLPGYGSLMMWLPEYGVGVIGMTNKTYTAPWRAMQDGMAALRKTGALEPRKPQPSAALLVAQRDVSRLVASWDDALAQRIAADNLFLDETPERRAAYIKGLLAKVGACGAPEEIKVENALRGNWKIPCERGWLEVWITLSPTSPPRVQALDVSASMPPDERTRETIRNVIQLSAAWDEKIAASIAIPGFDTDRLRKQVAAASAWGACSPGDAGGDGPTDTVVKLACEKGQLFMKVTLDPATGKLKDLAFWPSREQRCVP